MFKFWTFFFFFITFKIVFILSLSQPGLLIDPLCLCVKKKLVGLTGLCITTWQQWPTYVIHSMFCLFISLTDRFFCLLKLCWQGNYSEMGREAKEAEFTSLLLRDSVLEFNREFTMGQNLGSENFTSWSGGVVTAVWLNGENIFVCFLKISTCEEWYRRAILVASIFWALHLYFRCLSPTKYSENGTGVPKAAKDSLLFM